MGPSPSTLLLVARVLAHLYNDRMHVPPPAGCVQAVPFLIADANDKSSLADLAGKTDVIIATAGPFAKYGTNVVEASLEQGTHYCDITGKDQDV